MWKPENFSSYVRSDGSYVSTDTPSIYRGEVVYKIRVRWKSNQCSLTYATDCQMYVAD